MADIATLGIRVDYRDVKQADDAMNKLTRSATGATSALKLLAVAYVGYEALKSLVKVADAYTAMQSQIKLVTETTRELIYVQDQLNAVANNTYASMSETTKLYTAMEPTMRNLGRSTGESMRFIETFNKALTLTAPTVSESESAIRNFLQAMGSGVLRGDEFNTIMENGRGVAMALADGLKVPIGALRSMAEEGKLTADVVVQALESQRQAVDDKFGKMTMTVSQSSQIWSNEWMMFVGAVDKSVQGTEWLSNAIKSLATDLGTVTGFIADWGNASRAADLAVKDAADSASLFADSISTGDVLREVAGALYSLSDVFNYLSSSASFALKVLNTKIDTDTIDNLSEHYERYMLDLDILAKKKEVFIASLNKSKQAIADQAAEMKKLNLTANEYSSQAGMLYAQTAGFGTQTEMLLEQERVFGNTLIDVTKIMTTYGVETNAAMKFSEKGKDIIGKLQEQYTTLGVSVRDAAVAKAVFDAQNKGATPEEIAYIKDMAGRIYDLTEAKTSATTANKLHEKSIKSETKATEEATKARLEYLKTIQDDAYDHFEKNLQDSEAYTKKQADALEALRDELNPTMALYKKYGEQVLLINREADMSDTERADLIERLNKRHGDSLEELRLKNDTEYAAMTKIAEQALKRLDDAFADVWKDIFSGSKDFGQALKSWFTSLLAELAHQAITKPIMVKFSQQISGALGIGGGSGGTSGISALSDAYNAYSTGSMLSTAGSILSGGSTMMSYGASMAGIGSATSQGAMLAAQTGSFGAQGAALTGQALGATSTMGSVMSTLSTAMPYVAAFFALDAALGGKITSGIVTGITGGDWELKSVTAKLDVLEGVIDAEIIKREGKDGGWFNDSKSRYDDLATPELDKAIQDAYSQIYKSVGDLSTKLGYQVAEDFTASVSLSVKGKSAEEITASFQGMMVDIGNQLMNQTTQIIEPASQVLKATYSSVDAAYEATKKVTDTAIAWDEFGNVTVSAFESMDTWTKRLGDSVKTLEDGTVQFFDTVPAKTKSLADAMSGMALSGEQTYMTLARVMTQFDIFNQPIGRLNDSLIDLNMTTIGSVDALVKMTGGIANLQAMQSGFIDAIYTDAQKGEMITKTVDQLFANLGAHVPATKGALVSFVKSLDLTTEAGIDAYNAILNQTSTLNTYYSTVSSGSVAIQNAVNNIKSAIDRVNTAKVSAEYAPIASSISSGGPSSLQSGLSKAGYDGVGFNSLNSFYETLNTTLPNNLQYWGDKVSEVEGWLSSTGSANQAEVDKWSGLVLEAKGWLDELESWKDKSDTSGYSTKKSSYESILTYREGQYSKATSAGSIDPATKEKWEGVLDYRQDQYDKVSENIDILTNLEPTITALWDYKDPDTTTSTTGTEDNYSSVITDTTASFDDATGALALLNSQFNKLTMSSSDYLDFTRAQTIANIEAANYTDTDTAVLIAKQKAVFAKEDINALTKGWSSLLSSVKDADPIKTATETVENLFESLGMTVPKSSAELAKALNEIPNADKQKFIDIADSIGIFDQSLNDLGQTAKDKAATEKATTKDLKTQLLELTNPTKALTQAHNELLKTLTDEQQGIQKDIWVKEKLNAEKATTKDLNAQLLELTNPTKALANVRKDELKGLTTTQQATQKRIWALQDEKTALDNLASAQGNYKSALQSLYDFGQGLKDAIKGIREQALANKDQAQDVHDSARVAIADYYQTLQDKSASLNDSINAVRGTAKSDKENATGELNDSIQSLLDASNSAADQVKSLQETLADSLLDISNSLKDYLGELIDETKKGNEALRASDFDAAVSKALKGDSEAARTLPDIARSYLEEAYKGASSAEEYALKRAQTIAKVQSVDAILTAKTVATKPETTEEALVKAQADSATALKAYNDAVTSASTAGVTFKDTTVTLNDAFNNALKSFNDASAAYDYVSADMYSNDKSLTENYDDLTKELADNSKEITNLKESVKKATGDFDWIIKTFSATPQTIEDLVSEFKSSKDALKTATDEYNAIKGTEKETIVSLTEQYKTAKQNLTDFNTATKGVDFSGVTTQANSFKTELSGLTSALSTAKTELTNAQKTAASTSSSTSITGLAESVTNPVQQYRAMATNKSSLSAMLNYIDTKNMTADQVSSAIGVDYDTGLKELVTSISSGKYSADVIGAIIDKNKLKSANIAKALGVTEAEIKSAYGSYKTQFATGGYTGDGGKYDPAGIVHKGEYVVPAWQVDKYPQAISELEGIRRRGFASGGGVDLAIPMPNDAKSSNSDDFSAIIAELQALRAELAEIKAQDKQIGFQTIKYQKNVSDTVDKWDVNGMPINTEIELTV